jgi:hypothetical protein
MLANQTTGTSTPTTPPNGVATNQTPVIPPQLVAALANQGTPPAGTPLLVQAQGTQALAPNAAAVLLTQGQLQPPGNLEQYQPEVLLARLGFVGLLQADPNARFDLPRLLAGGGGEPTMTPADQEMLNRIRSMVVEASPGQSDGTQGPEQVPMPTMVSEASAPVQTSDEVTVSETP